MRTKLYPLNKLSKADDHDDIVFVEISHLNFFQKKQILLIGLKN